MTQAAATDADANQERAEPGAPYVGLRPYEPWERHPFFGRDHDAERLCNRILSSRITLFYAQSGLGKTSLLRALVIPQLKEENCSVFSFDAWTGEQPADALKHLLAKRLDELGLPRPSAAPTLVELVRLIASVDTRTPILVLDQFEEFLLAYGRRLDPLRQELAALVRATGLDVHVVMALREEFLAAIEPFRHSILNLFESTVRLDSLGNDAVREAIIRPAAKFGIACEPALVDALLDDLRGDVAPGTPDGPRPPVDLPRLQLVCSQLWEAGRASSADKLTLSLYTSIGRAEKIIHAYVRGVMPSQWGDRVVTAELMRYLAPPSGYKISYSIDDLVAITGLDRQRISDELDRLSRQRILLVRSFRSGPRYELQHDAFIEVIASWRDDILTKSSRLRWIVKTVEWGTLALMISSVVLFLILFHLFGENVVDRTTHQTIRFVSPSIPLAINKNNVDWTRDLLIPNKQEFFSTICIMGPDGNVYKTQNGEVFACWDKDDNFNMNLESEFSHEKFNDLKQTKWTFERNFSELRAAKAIIYHNI